MLLYRLHFYLLPKPPVWPQTETNQEAVTLFPSPGHLQPTSVPMNLPILDFWVSGMLHDVTFGVWLFDVAHCFKVHPCCGRITPCRYDRPRLLSPFTHPGPRIVATVGLLGTAL